VLITLVKLRTDSSFLTLGMRFERFLLDLLTLLALLDRIVAMITSSFDFDLVRLRTISLA
jgi:hypothetical protein